MRRGLCLIAAILVSLPASAQPKRHRIADWKFWLSAASMFAAQYADIATGRHCINAGACREANPILGQSAARQYGIGMGITAGEVVATYFIKKWCAESEDTDYEDMWVAAPVFHDTLHGVLAYHNAGMSVRPSCVANSAVSCRQ